MFSPPVKRNGRSEPCSRYCVRLLGREQSSLLKGLDDVKVSEHINQVCNLPPMLLPTPALRMISDKGIAGAVGNGKW